MQLGQQPVTGLVGQPDVQEHKRVIDRSESLAGLRAGIGDVGVETPAAEHAGHRLRQRRLVFDDQQPGSPTGVCGH